MKVKVECPSVDISKHLILIENVIKQFENMKQSGNYSEDILLKLEQDLTLVPISKKTFSLKEAREAERRLKDKAVLKQFMDKFNAQEDEELRAQETQLNIDKMLEVKDWKKAKYEINLAEMEKLKKAREEAEEEEEAATKEKRKKEKDDKVVDVSTAEEGPNETKGSKEATEKDDSINALNSKYIEKKIKKMKKDDKDKKNAEKDVK